MSPILGTYPTWKELYGHRPAPEEIVRELKGLQLMHTVLLLARLAIHLALDRFHHDAKQSTALQGFLIANFIDDDLLQKLKKRYGSERLDTRRAFHFQQILTLAKWALLECLLDGGVRPDENKEARYTLGRALIMTNDLLLAPGGERAISRFRVSPMRRLVALQLQLGSGFEINNPPEIRTSIVRSEIMFGEILAQISASLDVKATFKAKTGLELDKYVDMILAVLIHYITKDQQQLINDPGLCLINLQSFFNLVGKDDVQKFLRMEMSTLEEAGAELKKASKLKPQHDFIGFRRKPLLQVSEQAAVCINPGFLQEKLESGLFWSVFNSLDSDNERERLFHTWGLLFERYVAYLLSSAIVGGNETYVSFPAFADNNDEAFDGCVTAEDKWFVLEYKGGFLKSEAKYAEDEKEFIQDLELKFGTETGAGVEQLARKIGQVFSTEESKRRSLRGLNSSKVSVVIPILVVQDPFVSSEITARFLCERFRYLLRKEQLTKRVCCTGLLVLDVGDIEAIRPYLKSGQVRFSDCMMQRARLGDRVWSFRDLFLQYFEDNKMKPTSDPDFDERLSGVMERISVRLFGRSIEELRN